LLIQCPFDPNIYANQPIGMFHCPYCGEMQLAGLDHLPFQLEVSEEEYAEMVAEMAEIKNKMHLL